MTRNGNGPKDPKNGAGKRGAAKATGDTAKDGKSGRKLAANKTGADNIISLTSSPAFDTWLDRQTKKLVQASSTRPSDALVDLIRGWPGSPDGNNPKKGSGKITD